MNKKLYIAAAAVTLTLAACSDDSFIDSSAVKNTTPENTDGAIMFGAGANKLTRGALEDKQAADKLGSHFTVYAYKGTTNLPANKKELAFPFYAVKYAEGTAHTTASNTDDWEYVGYQNEPLAGESSTQIIKYWDYSAPYYNFLAWSIDPESNASVLNVETAITGTGAPDNGDKITFSAPSAKDAAAIYFSNRYTATNDGNEATSTGNYTVTKVDGKYNNTVKLTFRNLTAKVRLGIFETVPGYTVNDVVFYQAGTEAGYNNNSRVITVTTGDYPRSRTKNTYETVGEVTNYNKVTEYGECSACLFAKKDATPFALSGNFEVTYSGTDNVAMINKVAAGSVNASSFTFGEKSRSTVLGTTSNTATFWGNNEDENYYTIVLPMEDNKEPLYLKVDYTLTATDGSGENIRVQGATATVPAQYAQWKSNYAYTYLFKISDKTNGHTGGDTPGTPDDPEEDTPTDPTDTTDDPNPAGLFPITFDACVINTEDGNQETITTIEEATITTYQYGSQVTENDEYKPGTDKSDDIYVNVMVPTTTGTKAYELAALTAGTNAWLYTAAKLGNEEITEASVANGVSQIALTDITSELKVCNATDDVPTVDGYKFDPTTRAGAEEPVVYYYFLKFAPKANNTYVIKFKGADDKFAYKVIKVANVASASNSFVLGDITATYLNVATDVAISNTYNETTGKKVTAAATAVRIMDGSNDVTAQFEVTESSETAGTYSITPKRCVTNKEYTVNFGNQSTTLKVNAINITTDQTDDTFTARGLKPDGSVITDGKATITVADGQTVAEGETAVLVSGLEFTVKQGSNEVSSKVISIKDNNNGTYTISTGTSASGEYTLTCLGQSITIKVNNYSISFNDKFINDGNKAGLTVKCNGDNATVTDNTGFTTTNGSTAVNSGSVTITASLAEGAKSGDLLTVTYGNAYTSIIVKKFKLSQLSDLTDAKYAAISGTLGTDEKFIELTESGKAYTAAEGELVATNATLTPTSVKGVYKVKKTTDNVSVAYSYKSVAMTTVNVSYE